MSGPTLCEVGSVRFGHLCDCEFCERPSNPKAQVLGFRAACCSGGWSFQDADRLKVVATLVDHLRDVHGVASVSTLLCSPIKVCPSCEGMALFGVGCDCERGLMLGEPAPVDVPINVATEAALPGASS